MSCCSDCSDSSAKGLTAAPSAALGPGKVVLMVGALELGEGTPTRQEGPALLAWTLGSGTSTGRCRSADAQINLLLVLGWVWKGSYKA